MRVLHLLPFLGVGGTEQMVLYLCRFIDRQRFETRVIVPHEGIMAAEMRSAGASVGIGTDALAPALHWADLVNLHGIGYDPHWHELLQGCGKPYVFTLHWPTPLPAFPALTICTSQYAHRIQQNKERCIVIPNGVDVEQFTPPAREGNQSEIVIGRVCRPQKCALYFWEGIRKVLNRHPHVKVWIVGDNAPESASTDHIRFLGIRRDVSALLAQMDVFAYTPYPSAGTKDLVVMEAAAAGLPYVVSDVNGVEGSVMDGETGFLTPYGDVNAFAEKLDLLVRDADLRRRMGDQAAAFARTHCDIRDTVRRYEVVYEEIAASYRRSW